MTLEKLRKKKIYTRYRVRVGNKEVITIPEIRLEGLWLEKYGFTHGSQIVIQPEKNRLTIMVIG